MKLHLKQSYSQKLRLLTIWTFIFIPICQTVAQKSSSKHRKVTASKKRVTYTIPTSVVKQSIVNNNVETPSPSSGPNRLDVCIERNRKLVADISALNDLLSRQSNQIFNSEGTSNYYKMSLKNSRDSVVLMQKKYSDLLAMMAANNKVVKDSLESFQQLRNQVSRDKQKVVRDSNVVRVYNMPYDQVRVRVLRKVLDDGLGLVIERNTDEGFLVSKVFKDRKSKGMFKKTVDTRVDCDIRMVQHPYQDNKTLFYATTRVQESNGNNSYIELTDPELIKDYQKKLLKFFDDFLVSQ
jgi:hypothetical protein